MSGITLFVTILQLLCGLVVILAVLFQSGKSAGLSGTIGGVAALLAKSVTASEMVGWDDLGTEALRRLTLENFPCYVAVDTQGRDLYREIEHQTK